MEVLLLGAFVLYAAMDLVGSRLDGNAGARATAIASMFARLVEAALALGVAYVVLRGRSPVPILAATLLSAVLGSIVALSQVMGVEAIFGNLIDPGEVAARVIGAFDDPNYFGSYLAIMITLAVACLMNVDARWLKVALFALATLFSITLLFTQSRGALVALMAGLAVLALLRSRRTGLLTVGALVLIVAVAYPVFSEWRFGDAGPSSVMDTAGRSEAWQEGAERLHVIAPLRHRVRAIPGGSSGRHRGAQLVCAGAGRVGRHRDHPMGPLHRRGGAGSPRPPAFSADGRLLGLRGLDGGQA